MDHGSHMPKSRLCFVLILSPKMDGAVWYLVLSFVEFLFASIILVTSFNQWYGLCLWFDFTVVPGCQMVGLVIVRIVDPTSLLYCSSREYRTGYLWQNEARNSTKLWVEKVLIKKPIGREMIKSVSVQRLPKFNFCSWSQELPNLESSWISFCFGLLSYPYPSLRTRLVQTIQLSIGVMTKRRLVTGWGQKRPDDLRNVESKCSS